MEFHAHTWLVFGLVLLVNLIVGAQSQCSFSSGGHTFDFSSLTLSGSSYHAPDSTNHYYYWFNVCAGVDDPAHQACNTTSTVCQYDHTQSPPTIASIVATWPGGTFSLAKPGDLNGGVKLSFADGDPTGCGGPRKLDITFQCGSGAPTASEDPNVQCEYHINFPTELACPDHKDTGKGGSKDTGGWVFFGLVLGIAFLYIVIGCAFNWHKSGGEGGPRDWCPNNGFWFALPGLVKDGCIYTGDGIKRCIGKITGQSADYDTVE